MQPVHRGQPSSRATKPSDRSRGRGRGRGTPFQRGGSNGPSTSHDTSQRGSSISPFRGSRGRGTPRGRGHFSKRFDSPPATMGKQTLAVLPTNPPPEQIKPYDHEKLEARRAKLNEQYDKYRQTAIARGLMSDDKQSSLGDAIKTVGTCTEMCDEKERVNRIYESQTDAAERLPSPETGRSVPIEGRMVKKFRRSAAGVDKQIPEELRTPRTLQKTLDYLFDEIIGKNRLGKHHKFVWDRTRAIRNDFSIQSLTNPEHVKYEVDCYERIVRFHILSAHQLSNPENLAGDEHFEHQQELEQLQKTFQSLMDRYDAFRSTIDFPNEPEFRAYYILFSPVLFSFDTEVQIQRWPKRLLNDGRVHTALALYAAMGNTTRTVGSKNLDPVPVAVAQANSGRFWALLDSQRVGYLMACVAEISFQNVRFTALDALWRSAKVAFDKVQAKMTTWTKQALTDYLYFDDESETEAFCERVGVSFAGAAGEEYLDFRSRAEPSLDNPFSKPEQVFSESIVENKRQGRTLVAVMNGMSIAQARRAHMIEDDSERPPVVAQPAQNNSMFIGDDDEDEQQEQADGGAVGTQQPSVAALNPQAAAFTPAGFGLQTSNGAQPKWMTAFGQERSPDSASPDGPPKGLFGSKETPKQQEQTSALPSTNSGAQSSLKIAGTTAASPFAASTNTGFVTVPATNRLEFSKPSSPFPTGVATQPPAKTQQSPTIQPSLFNLTPQTKPLTGPDPKPVFNWSTTSATSSDATAKTSPRSLFDKPTEPSTSSVGFSFGFTGAPPSMQTVQPLTSQPAKPLDFGFSSSITASQTPPSKPVQSTRSLFNTSPLSGSKDLPSFPASLQGIQTQSSPVESSQPPAKRPSTGETKFPAASKPFATSESTAPPGSFAPPPSERDPVDLAQPPPSPRSTSTTVAPQPLPVVAEEPPQPSIDEDQILTQLCRIGLVQEDGILDMFVSYRLAKLVKDVFQEFQQKQFKQRTTILKHKYLIRKFFAKWRFVIEQRRLQKRAQRRRQKLAASIHAANEKRRKQEEEMADIVEARAFKSHMEREQKRKLEEAKRREQERLQRKAQKMKDAAAVGPSSTNPNQKAGQKRKMLANSTSSSNIEGIFMSPMHKRSRTLGSSEDADILRASLVPKRSPRSSLNGSESLRRSISQRSLRQSLTQQRLDQTKTDYFLLKAHGVDPETPLVPETAAEVAARKQRETERRASVNARVLKRPHSTLDRSSAEVSSRSSPMPPAVLLTSPSPATASLTAEDPFLRQLREAREALGADQDWFQSHTEELEKEIEQHEEFRRSRDSISSRDGSAVESPNGFARSVSGRQYISPILKPGQTLSRTELRIQQTGARGLATKPIGGTPAGSPQSDYAVIAMSKRTASQLQSSHLTQAVQAAANAAVQSGKRSISQIYGNGHSSTNEDEAEPGQHLQQSPKKQRKGVTTQALGGLLNIGGTSPDPFDHTLEDEDDEGFEDEEEEDLDDGGQQDLVEGAYDDEEYEDEEDDEEAAEDAELYDDEEADGGYRHGEYLGEEVGYEDENGDYLPVPPQRGSRAVSSATADTGAGSTADAAIELSD